MYNKILLPTDGSGYADQEIDRVTKLIADDGEIIILSVAGKLTSSAFQSRKKVRRVNKGTPQVHSWKRCRRSVENC